MSESSNDLLADRRFAWAKALAAEGDHAAAADLLDQVVERVPAWGAGWAALGEARDRLGQTQAALAAWRRAVSFDAGGRLGAALQAGRLGAEAPVSMPDAYVRALFDDYAPRFDRHLLDGLRYRGPTLLAAALDKAAPGRRFTHALDLGCGTGLMGRALAGRAARIDGLDLSPAMVALAGQTGCYGDLSVASIEAGLGGAPAGRYDLVTAADVLVYVGELAPLMAGVARALSHDGVFGFTAQSGPAGQDIVLGADLRFSYSPGYVAASARAAGLPVLSMEAMSSRSEGGVAVPGLVCVAGRG